MTGSMRTMHTGTPFRWALAVFLALGMSSPVAGAVYQLSSYATDPPDRVCHVPTYDGTGGPRTLSVCIAPGSPNIAEMQIPIQNVVQTFNALLPTTGNVATGAANNVPATALDFESFLLMRLSYCLGLNLTFEPPDGYTEAQLGPNAVFDRDPGPDAIPGSGDDLRGDDVNVHWFSLATNNPFILTSPVDSLTYGRDPALLPGSDTFAAAANLGVAAALGVPNTEAITALVIPADYARRSLTADDVAGLRYAMSGIDELAGTGDDYTFQLEYQGISDTCDFVILFQPSTLPTPSFSLGAVPISGNPKHYAMLSTCNVNFGELVNWYFNTTPSSCSQSQSLIANQWDLISLPCDTGALSTVQDLFGDDLAPADYGVRWALFERDEFLESYTMLALADFLNPGEGYWVLTFDSGQSLTVEGDPGSEVDVPLATAPDGRQNLVGHPFNFDVCWADAQIVDGASVLSLDQADPLIGAQRACSMLPPDASCVMSRQANKWGGASYELMDGVTPTMEGTLHPFDGFWVEAFKPGIALRVPASPGVNCTTCTPQPVADAGPDQAICQGDAVTVGTPALPGHSYDWSPGGETTAQISVAPVATTTYTVSATTVCNTAQDDVTVTVVTTSDAFQDDLEGFTSGWIATGLWHLTDSSACPAPAPGYASPTHAFYYGREFNCNFNTGARNAGTLTSPPITGITALSELSFEYLRNAETGGAFDVSTVEIVAPGGPVTVLSLNSSLATTWTSGGPISLDAFAGETIQVRFRFDSIDSVANAGFGWLIDDVTVTTGVACSSGMRTSPRAVSTPEKTPPSEDSFSWWVRLAVQSQDLLDTANVLGQLGDALDGYDYHDLLEPAPFGERYLSIVFPHQDWGDHAGDYSSDFRAAEPPLHAAWRFDVIGAGYGPSVTLRWDSQGFPLDGWWLLDEATGEKIRLEAEGSYSFEMTGSRRSFRWYYNAKQPTTCTALGSESLPRSGTVTCGAEVGSTQFDWYRITAHTGDCVHVVADNGAGAADLLAYAEDAAGTAYGLELDTFSELDDERPCSVEPWSSGGCPEASVSASASGAFLIAVAQSGPSCSSGLSDYTLFTAVNGTDVVATQIVDDGAGPGAFVFADGFESGDLAFWASGTP